MKPHDAHLALAQANPVRDADAAHLPLADAEEAMLATILDSGPTGGLQQVPVTSGRRALFALAGAGATAVAVGVLILSSGSNVEPAVAGVLRQSAAVAASGIAAPTQQAGSGQYYFTERKEVEFMGWYPGSYSVVGGPATRPRGFSALIPKETEYWLSSEGGFRARQKLGMPRFLTGAEKDHWEEAGSPLPKGFDPRFEPSRERAGARVFRHRRGVLEIDASRAQMSPEGFPDLSKTPTDPRVLRLAIRTGRALGISEPWGTPVGVEGTVQILAGILSAPNAGASLRAAAFDALAEIPGFTLNREAADLVGRPGYAISYDAGHGERDELIIDPATSALLGERIVLADAEQDPQWKGYPAGLTIRDVAYLRSTVVNSTRRPVEERRGGGRLR